MTEQDPAGRKVHVCAVDTGVIAPQFILVIKVERGRDPLTVRFEEGQPEPAVFVWNSKREKDTTLTPMDSIKYHLQMEQAGFMAMDPVTGEVRAWVGGIDFKTYKNDHVNLNTKRQVGSTIKPFLYTQAMEERGFTPETECENVAQFFPGSGWVPSGRKCGGGSMSMANALAFSKNCATAYIMKQFPAFVY